MIFNEFLLESLRGIKLFNSFTIPIPRYYGCA